MAIFNRSWIILLPLFFILSAYNSSLLDPTQPIKFFLLSVFCFVLNLILLIKLRREKTKEAFLFHPILLLYAIYIVLAGFSLLYTTSFAHGLYEWLKQLLYFNLFVLGVSYLKSKRELKLQHFTLFISLFQILIVLTWLTNLFMNNENIFELQNKIAGGLFVNANLSAQILFLTLPYSLYGSFNGRNNLIRYLTIGSSLLTLITIVVLGSKAVILSLGLALLLIFVGSLKEAKQSILVKLSPLVLIVIMLGISFTTYLFFPKIEKTDSFQVRKELWTRTISSISDQALLGHGLGTWRVNNLEHVADSIHIESKSLRTALYSNKGDHFYERPHNDFLWVWDEVGIVSLTLYILLLLAAFKYGWLTIKSSQKKEKLFYQFLLFTLAGYILISLFSFPKERIEQSTFLTLILLFIVSAPLSQKDKKGKLLFKLSPSILFSILIVVSGCTIYVASNRLLSEYQFTEALKAKEQQNWRLVKTKAIKSINNYYTIGSNGIPPDWYAGVAAMNLNQLELAHYHFTEAYGIHPTHVQVLNNLATTSTIMGNIEYAKELYLKALHINPYFEDARINLSGVYYNESNIVKAWATICRLPFQCDHDRYTSFFKAIFIKKYQSEHEYIEETQLPIIEKFFESEKQFLLMHQEFLKTEQSRGEILWSRLNDVILQELADQEPEQKLQ